jgi:hypothetical protein
MEKIKDAVAKDEAAALLPEAGKEGGGGFKRDDFSGGHF